MMVGSTPYAVPHVFLPVDSRVPRDAADVKPDSLSAVAIPQAAAALSHVHRLFTMHVLAPPEISTYLTLLDMNLRAAAGSLRHELAERERTANREASDALTEAQIKQELAGKTLDQAKPPDYMIYDQYFRVYRVEKLRAVEYRAQALTTFSNVALDLPYAMLGFDEINALLRAMLACIESYGLPAGPPIALGETAPALYGAADDLAGYWFLSGATPGGLVVRSHSIATYRWITGHHLFNIFSNFCLDSLLRAADASRDVAELEMSRATAMLRGTTAAMWYAGAFPAQIYGDDVRPQMVSTRAPKGFAGNQNADYERMKHQKEPTLKALRDTYAGSGKWSREADPEYGLLRAIIRFLQIDLEDAEHHVLIASARVGTEAPTLSEDVRLKKGKTERAEAAVDQLRTLLEAERQERLRKWQDLQQESMT